MHGPNCVHLVECDGCSHPSQKKVLWLFNRRCVIVSGKHPCELQEEFPQSNGIDMTDILVELRKNPPKKS